MARGGLKFLRGAVADYVGYFLGEDGRGCTDHGYYGAGQRWSVSAAGRLVEGDWSPEAYGSWLSGADPNTGEKRGRSVFDGELKSGVRGYEYSVNVPKSASLVAALDPELGRALIRAQERAADAGLTVVLSRARTRLTRGGVTRLVPVESLEVAVFSHDGSREGDPHQHLHVQVGSKVFVEGQWSSLAGRPMTALLREWQVTVTAALATDAEWIAACALRGLTVTTDGGVAEISESVEEEFSTRHVVIAAKTAELIDEFNAANGRRPTARELVWIDQKAWDLTRPKKGEKALLSADVISDRLRALGLGPLLDRLNSPRSRAKSPSFDPATATQAGLALAVQREVLREEDIRILAAEAISSTGGACTNVTDAIAEVASAIRANCVTVDLPGGLTGFVPTPVLVSAEIVHEHLAAARATANAQEGLLHLDAAGLTPGQQVAAEAVAAGLPVVIEGPAGTGKTTALRRALAARTAAGLNTVAVAPSAAAVHQLGDGWSSASTAHTLLVRSGWTFDDSGQWTAPSEFTEDVSLREAALVVDEAAMLDLHTMSALARHATSHAARLILVGDDRQLSPVGVAGGFTLASMTTDPVRLVSAQRFSDPNHAAVAAAFRSSADVDEVIDQVLGAGLVIRHDTESDAQVALAEIAATDRNAIVMGADNDSAVVVNRLVHAERAAAGEVTESHDRIGRLSETIGVGDLVQTRRNDNFAGVFNRQRWIVEAIHSDGSMTVSRADRSTITKSLSAEYVAAHVHRADAVTVHAAQGATATQAHALVDTTWSREQAYVALTRGKHGNTLHVVAEDETGVRDVLTQVLHSSDRARAHALADIVLGRQRQARTDLVPSLASRITDTLVGATKAAWERVGSWGSAPTSASLPDLIPPSGPGLSL
jgi:exodeoxyribonuclease V alpha subunit